MDVESAPGTRATGFTRLLALGVCLALFTTAAAILWCTFLYQQFAAIQKNIADLDQKNAALVAQQVALEDRLHAATETLGQSVGLTQKQIELRTARLSATQAAEAAAVKAQTTRIEREQQASTEQITKVAGDVTNVKTEVGGAQATIAATQTDLAETKAQLQRTIGDEGVMSGLIARTHDDVETLRHKGERDYFEFTLTKGGKPSLLANTRLQLKKVDTKHSRYTLIVSSDDHTIEKKDKGIDEPIQFYTGKVAALEEIVVNSMTKSSVSGYLSVPKASSSK